MTINKPRKIVVSANERRIGASNRNSPRRGGKTHEHRLANQNAVMRIIECNDHKVANIFKPITECQLREFAINSFRNNNITFDNKNNSTMTSISLKKLNNLLLRHPESTSGSSSAVEVVDARLESETTNTRDVK